MLLHMERFHSFSWLSNITLYICMYTFSSFIFWWALRLFPSKNYFLNGGWVAHSVQFSSVHSVVSDFLWPHESQHARPPCPSPTPRIYSNSCPLSRWCHPAISSSVVPFSLLPPIPPSIRVFSNESALRMRWPKYWSFSLSKWMVNSM